MNENLSVDSFFFQFDLFVSLFFSSVFILYSKPFWKNWSLLQDFFCWNITHKRKLEKYFLGTRIWVPKPRCCSSKQPEYITVLYHLLICSWPQPFIHPSFYQTFAPWSFCSSTELSNKALTYRRFHLKSILKTTKLFCLQNYAFCEDSTLFPKCGIS